MIIRDISTWDCGKIVFSKDQTTITIISGLNFYVYGLSGEQICEGELLPSFNHQLGAYWVDEKSLLFAISSKTKEGLIIDIQELQPTSDPPLIVVKSFPVSPQDGSFQFSPVSSHVLFITDDGFVILDVQDSKVLLKVQGFYRTNGHFSPDGHFLSCQTSDKMDIWENTSAGYVLWGSLRARLPWHRYSWSPTSASILCWGAGIQLLHLDDSFNSAPPNKEDINHHGGHLVAYPADQAYVATTSMHSHNITVFNLEDSTQLSIDTNIYISDMRIIGDTIFVTDGSRLFSWCLTTGGQVDSTGDAKRENRALYVRMGGIPVLSNDCSQIAFTIEGTVFLYDVKAHKVLGKVTTDANYISHMQFSSNGYQLWIIARYYNKVHCKCYCVGLERAIDPCFTNVTIEDLGRGQSLDTLFRSPHEYRIVGNEYEWVSDSRGNLLWLPPYWRSEHGLEIKWNNNILALVDRKHPKPIIIEFQ